MSKNSFLSVLSKFFHFYSLLSIVNQLASFIVFYTEINLFISTVLISLLVLLVECKNKKPDWSCSFSTEPFSSYSSYSTYDLPSHYTRWSSGFAAFEQIGKGESQFSDFAAYAFPFFNLQKNPFVSSLSSWEGGKNFPFFWNSFTLDESTVVSNRGINSFFGSGFQLPKDFPPTPPVASTIDLCDATNPTIISSDSSVISFQIFNFILIIFTVMTLAYLF